jgi:hypothetical protein
METSPEQRAVGRTGMLMNPEKMIAIVIAFGMTNFVTAQTLTDRIKDAKVSGAPVVVGVLGEVQPLTVEELSAQSDLVLEAKLSRLRTYVNARDTAVVTDFAIIPDRALKGSVTSATMTPGIAAPLILTTLGGEVVRDGILVTTENHNMRPLREGVQYLLFLTKFGTEKGVYQIFNAAAFELTGDRIRMLAYNSSAAYKDIEGTPYGPVAARVLEAAQSK